MTPFFAGLEYTKGYFGGEELDMGRLAEQSYFSADTTPVPVGPPIFTDDTGDAQAWRRGRAITPVVVPRATGNPTPTYAVVGSLPDGITFTPSTRRIDGTPSALGSGTITIRATNSEGSDDWTIAYATTSPPVSGYPVGYWLDFVRSSSTSSIVEDASGIRVWMRTSDGEPLEQQYLVSGVWTASEDSGFAEFPARGDTVEPDFIGNVGSNRFWRARKAGLPWLPSDAGSQYGQVSWGGMATFRAFTQPDVPAPPLFADDTGDAQAWTQNSAIPDIVIPAAAGNPPPTYAVQGSLPAGITFDADSRTLAGTPTALGSGTITIRATNTLGFDDWTVAYTTTAAAPMPTLPTHTYSIVAGGAGSVGYNAIAGIGSIAAGSTATYTTPGGKSVTVIHTRNVGAEVNFGLSGAADDAADFPMRIRVTRGTVVREFTPQAGSRRAIQGGIRQDYDPVAGTTTDVFVSGQTLQVELFY